MGHRTLSKPDCRSVRRIAAVLVAHSVAVRSAGSRAAMPRMTLTGKDGSIAAAVERAANTRVSVTPTGEHLGHVRSRTSCVRSEEHTSELQSHHDLVCRLLLEKKKKELKLSI